MGKFSIKSVPFSIFFLTWVLSILGFGVLYWALSPIASLSAAGNVLSFTGNGFIVALHASLLAATLAGISSLSFTGIAFVIMYLQMIFSGFIVLLLIDKALQKWFVPFYHLHQHQDKKINTVTVLMSLFREQVDKAEYSFKARTKEHVNIKEIEAIIDGLYVAFLEIEKLFSEKNLHRHKISIMQYLMLSESIDASLHKLSSFIDFLDRHKIEWKDNSTIFWTKYILETAEHISDNVEEAHLNNPRLLIVVHHIRERAEQIEKKI